MAMIFLILYKSQDIACLYNSPKKLMDWIILIKNFDKSMVGEYTIEAKNSVGSEEYKFNLQMIEAEPVPEPESEIGCSQLRFIETLKDKAVNDGQW